MTIKKQLSCTLMAAFCATAEPVYTFDSSTDINTWHVVNDGVMGGVSQGYISRTTDGHGVFSGRVSLDNNGGFTSVRHTFNSVITVGAHTQIVLRVKGDGKKYQLRIKEDTRSPHSYVGHFDTTGEWQVVTIDLARMYPSFRGRRLDMPNFNHKQISEVMLLIANKKAEEFTLIIDSIALN